MAQEITTDMAESAASQTEFYTVTVNQDEESPHEVLNTSETKDSFVADDREHSPVSFFIKIFINLAPVSKYKVQVIFIFNENYLAVCIEMNFSVTRYVHERIVLF